MSNTDHQLQEQIAHFFGVADRDVDLMVQRFKEMELPKGKSFARQDQVCDRLAFIRSGYIRIHADRAGKEVTQWIASPGYFVTELNGLLFGQRSRWSMTALTDCNLLVLDKSDYQQLAVEVPSWHQVEKLFLAKCFTILEGRVFGFLSMPAEERLQALYDHQRELFLEVPQQYLASMLGMTPETFSRLRKKLA